MFASETFRESFFSFAPPTERISQLFTRVRSALRRAGGQNKAEGLHQVLRLDIVSGLGATPAMYGWHVDALLNVGFQPSREAFPSSPPHSSHPRIGRHPIEGLRLGSTGCPDRRGTYRSVCYLRAWPAMRPDLKIGRHRGPHQRQEH